MSEMGSNKIKRCFYVGASFSKSPENFCFKVADFNFVVLKIYSFAELKNLLYPQKYNS